MIKVEWTNADALNLQPTCNQLATDCISRQAAIDALDKRFDDVPMELTTEILQLRRDLRERIPSAQPAISCLEFPNSSNDCISRQAAIDMLKRYEALVRAFGYNNVIEAIREVPSEQPEIIRCKDCKHQPFDSEDTQGFGVEFPDGMCPCQCEDGWYNWRPNNEWFCANAERRTDG